MIQPPDLSYMTEADWDDLRAEAAEIDAMTPEQLAALEKTWEPAEVSVLPGARMWCWRDGALVPLDNGGWYMEVLYDTGWISAKNPYREV